MSKKAVFDALRRGLFLSFIFGELYLVLTAFANHFCSCKILVI